MLSLMLEAAFEDQDAMLDVAPFANEDGAGLQTRHLGHRSLRVVRKGCGHQVKLAAGYLVESAIGLCLKTPGEEPKQKIARLDPRRWLAESSLPGIADRSDA